MKKWFVLLLCLALLACAAAMAEEETPQAAPDLFDLYRVREDGAEWLGTAIPIQDSVVMTSAACLPEDMGTLVITDGSAAWDPIFVLYDDTETVAVVFYSIEESRPAIGGFAVESDGLTFDPQFSYVRVGDEMYSRMNREIYSAAAIRWRERPCLLLNLSGPAAPGSPVISDSGELTGMVVAEYAEGTDRVVVFPAGEIRRCLAEVAKKLESPDSGLQENPPEGYTVTVERNEVVFDWSGMALPETAEGESLYLVVADVANEYLTYMEIMDGETATIMCLTPGRAYISGILASKGMPAELPSRYVTTELPAAEKLTSYHFRSQICALVESDKTPVPLTEVTEEQLRSGKLFFYSKSTYIVDQTIENLSLLVTLTAPDGQNYRYVSSWVYDPSYMKNDAWGIQINETGLLEMLNQNGYPRGTYELAMYIGGELADSSTFELK